MSEFKYLKLNIFLILNIKYKNVLKCVKIYFTVVIFINIQLKVYCNFQV